MPISQSSSSATASDRRAPARLGAPWSAAIPLLACALFLQACDVGARDRPLNVVLICMDTVRADHLGCYGYERHPTTPALDELAERSILFEDASATAGWTKPSVPSYFTGTYPCQHGVYEGSARERAGAVTDVLPESAETLAEAFRDHGYRTAAFVKNAQLRPGNGFEQGFDVYIDEAGDAREIRWRAQDWLDGIEGDRPFFLYLHVLDAHWPYAVPDEWATLFAAAEDIAPYRGGDSRALRDAINDGEVEFGDAEREALEALYDGAIRYVDDQIGLFLRGLTRRGLAEDTVVCVISDHGEEFGEHGRIGHGHGLHENLLRVPWILHVPGREARRVKGAVSLVDLFPTLLAAAGIRGGERTEGANRLLEPDLERPIFAEHKASDRYLHSLRRNERKLVRTFRPPERAPDAETIPISVGERWEAELERLASGELRATQLKPRDEPASDPIELKDSIRRLEQRSFVLGGIDVIYDDDTQRVLTEEARSEDLSEGLGVKVTGAFSDGAFLAERIKLYGPASEDSFELRGPVAEKRGVRSDGRIRIGPLWIRIDAGTAFKDAPERKPRMEREAILEILAEGAAEIGRRGFDVDSRLFQLSGPAAERELATGAIESDAMFGSLDEIGRRLVERRVFAAEDRKLLGEEELQDLQAIGYVR